MALQVITVSKQLCLQLSAEGSIMPDLGINIITFYSFLKNHYAIIIYNCIKTTLCTIIPEEVLE